MPRDFIDLGRTLELPERRILRRIVLPSAMPAIWDSLRISLGWAWTWLVVAELVAATSGPRLPHHHRAALLPDRPHLRLPPAPRLLGLATDQAMKDLGRRLVPLPRDAPMTPKLSIIAASARPFGPNAASTVALDGIDLAIGENEFVSLVGTSGCGKSTLLSIVAGLDSQDEGVYRHRRRADRGAGPRPRRRLPELHAAALADRPRAMSSSP